MYVQAVGNICRVLPQLRHFGATPAKVVVDLHVARTLKPTGPTHTSGDFGGLRHTCSTHELFSVVGGGGGRLSFFCRLRGTSGG